MSISTKSRTSIMGNKDSMLSYGRYSIDPSMAIINNNKSLRKIKPTVDLLELMEAMYPGVRIGHRFCLERPMLVPKTMGWLWNSENSATGVPFPCNWRPGAISMGVKKRFVKPRMSEPLSTPVGPKGKKLKKKAKPEGSITTKSTEDSLSLVEEKKILPPTLCVRKEGGVYKVTMQPMNDDKQDKQSKGDDANKPLHFQIASNSSTSKSAISSSSSLKIEYLCMGTLRNPVVKPKKEEMATQYEDISFQKETPQIKSIDSSTIKEADKNIKKIMK